VKLPTEKKERSIDLKMTPMIDVVFLLLVFFVWTSSFDLPEFDLPSSLAQPPVGGVEAQTPMTPVEEFDEIIISLENVEGQLVIEINDEQLPDLMSLAQRLRLVLSLGIQPPVIIAPSHTVTMKQAVRVYDLARKEGADRVLFAAKSD